MIMDTMEFNRLVDAANQKFRKGQKLEIQERLVLLTWYLAGKRTRREEGYR